MNKKILGSLILALGFVHCAYADFQLNMTDPSCTFMTYKNGKWVVAPAAELPSDAKFTQISPMPTLPNVSAGRWNGAWYRSSRECFVNSGGSEELGGGSKTSKSSKPSSKSTGYKFVELSLQHVSGLASAADESGVDSSPGVTTTTTSFTPSLSYGLTLGMFWNDHQGVALNFEHLGGSMDTTITATGLSVDLPLSESESHISAHYLHYFLKSGFRPFFDLGLGYSSQTATITVTGFPSPFTDYNGTVQYSGSGPLFNIKVGYDLRFDTFSIVPYLNYEWEKYSNVQISSSSSSLEAAGTSVGSSIGHLWVIGISGRFWF